MTYGVQNHYTHRDGRGEILLDVRGFATSRDAEAYLRRWMRTRLAAWRRLDPATRPVWAYGGSMIARDDVLPPSGA